MEYSEVVLAEVRGNATEGQANMLKSDLLAWRDELASIVSNCDEQFSSRKSRMDALADELGTDDEFLDAADDYDHWKRKALTFKRFITDRLRDVKRMIREQNVANDQRAKIRGLIVTQVRALIGADVNDDEKFDEAMSSLETLVQELDSVNDDPFNLIEEIESETV